jgi:uncharacterized protein (TIGR02217 family)
MTLTTTSFIETQFPSDISYNSSGGPGFSTTVFTSTSGFEQRNINWAASRAVYDCSQAVKTVEQMDTVLAFFMSMMGKAYAFRYKDWADYMLVNQNLINTVTGTPGGDGATLIFQLVNVYTAGPQSFTRTIKKPVTGTLTNFTVNGVPVASDAVSVDYTTGLVTFTSAPGSTLPVVVSYIEFDTPVRFDTDVASIRQENFMIESWEGIKLVEVKLP